MVDLISELVSDVIVVGRNRLGTINHTLLTVNTLQARGLHRISVVIVDECESRSICENQSKHFKRASSAFQSVDAVFRQ